MAFRKREGLGQTWLVIDRMNGLWRQGWGTLGCGWFGAVDTWIPPLTQKSASRMGHPRLWLVRCGQCVNPTLAANGASRVGYPSVG